MHDKMMEKAITLSEHYMSKGEGGPFGCVIVKDGNIVGEGWNTVLKDMDPTGHAEMNAIRKACKNLNTFELTDCVLYTSCEPCPMCLSAIYWARIGTVYYANSREDAKNIEFDDLFIYNEIALNQEDRSIKMVKLDNGEAIKVFEQWKGLEGKMHY